MKKAGEYMAAIIDANLYSKVKAYSGFFSSWAQIAQSCGIAAAAGYSRIRELERGILMVEADHPGWVQLLQTKAQQLLSTAQRRFPELDIRGISFTLSRPGAAKPGEAGAPQTGAPPGTLKGETEDGAVSPIPATGAPGPSGRGETAAAQPEHRTKAQSWERIEDPALKDSLKRLEQNLKGREKR
ncbi:MAG: DciA family protein [Treponema sp.]|jgi:hypothetical protein|nr:DciA family protein [Treponema sp.]